MPSWVVLQRTHRHKGLRGPFHCHCHFRVEVNGARRVLWAESRLRHYLKGKNQTTYHNSGCEHTFWNLCYHSVHPWAQDSTSELDGVTLVLRWPDSEREPLSPLSLWLETSVVLRGVGQGGEDLAGREMIHTCTVLTSQY